MNTNKIIEEIESLPISKRIYIIEKTIHKMRIHEEKEQMQLAAERLYSEYNTNQELTIFTNLDYEHFHETR